MSKDGFFVIIVTELRYKLFFLKANTKAHLALLGTNIFFAVNFSTIKYLMSEGYTKPFALNLIRVGATALLLWFLFIFKPVKSFIKKEDFGRLALCALTGIAVNQLLFVKGLSYTYPIHASLLMLSTPILITFLAAWLLKEKLNTFKIAGLILGIAGAFVLITSKAPSPPGTNVLLGDTLILMNAIAYTFYIILVKPLMHKYNPVVIIRSIFTIGFFMMLPFCWQEFTEIQWGTFNAIAWPISLL